MIDGWNLIEKYVDKKIKVEIQLIELFILTITAEIVIISISEYKQIVIPILINIIGVIYLVIMLAFDLNAKKSRETLKKFSADLPHLLSVPFRWKDFIPLVLYIVSIVWMGIIILIPIIN